MSEDGNTAAPTAMLLNREDNNMLSVDKAIAFTNATEDEFNVDINTANTQEAEDTLPSLAVAQQLETETKIAYNSAATNYTRKNNSLKSLVVMAIGLKNEDCTPFFNGEDEPWSSMLKVAEWKPTMESLVEEILRRWNVYNFASHGIKNEPRPKRWGVKVATEWLEAHPIDWKADGISVECDLDAEFVKEEIALRKVQLEEAVASKAAQNAMLEGRWTGSIPALWLIHALIEHDDIKQAYLTRLNSLTRAELENRNSTKNRDATVWELIAQEFNDPTFNPVTKILLLSHEDFIVEIDLSYSKVAHMAEATPDKVKEKFSSMTLAPKRKIQNWEASGQGDGGVLLNNDGEEEYAVSTSFEFGQLTGRP
jgi:hypothetical protein